MSDPVTQTGDGVVVPRPITEHDWPPDKRPVVSICCIAYNQEKFIRECLDGFLMQETSFPVEILVHDDASTDRTAKIIRDYESRFPRLFRTIFQEENQYQKGKRILAPILMPHARGEYIAVCEGDDYWTDRHKLEKQVSALSLNPEFSLCFHNSMIVYPGGKEEESHPFHWNLMKAVFTTEDLFREWFVPTASIVFRKYPDWRIPDWYNHCKSADIALLLLLSLRGKLMYLTEVMSVYRRHHQGLSWSAAHQGYQKVIGMTYLYESFNIHTNYAFAEKIQEAIIAEIRMHLPELCASRKSILRNPWLRRSLRPLKPVVSLMSGWMMRFRR